MHESNGVVDELTALFCTNFLRRSEHEDDDEHEDDTLVAAPPHRGLRAMLLPDFSLTGISPNGRNYQAALKGGSDLDRITVNSLHTSV
jgi:hypothetical protein